MVALGLLAVGCVVDHVEVANFLESLAKLRTEFRTIEIDFTILLESPGGGARAEGECELRMLRDKDGSLFGLLHVLGRTPLSSFQYVLRDDELYKFTPSLKTVNKMAVTKAGPLAYLAENWHGAIWLLSREEAQKRCKIRIWKRSEHYTYFDVKAEEYPLLWWKAGEPQKFTREYRFAVVARDTKEWPRHSIRQIALFSPGGDTMIWSIKRWAIDRDEARSMSAKDFPDPANLPEGWKVTEPVDWAALLGEARKEVERQKTRP